MKTRFQFLDTLRGFALLLMVGYHFSFDLDSAGVIHLNFLQPFWIAYRTVILVLFLGVAGVSISLGGKLKLLRLLILAACAGLISLATWQLFPDAWVFFGVLHFMFIANLLGPLLARVPRLCLPLGITMILLPLAYQSAVFDGGLLQLTGLCLHKPRTVDFVPFLPWLGVVLVGLFLGSYIRGRNIYWMKRGEPAMAALGSQSLLFYMTHQILLLPLAWLIAHLLK